MFEDCVLSDSEWIMTRIDRAAELFSEGDEVAANEVVADVKHTAERMRNFAKEMIRDRGE